MYTQDVKKQVKKNLEWMQGVGWLWALGMNGYIKALEKKTKIIRKKSFKQ